jgi:hypothetical protein
LVVHPQLTELSKLQSKQIQSSPTELQKQPEAKVEIPKFEQPNSQPKLDSVKEPVKKLSTVETTVVTLKKPEIPTQESKSTPSEEIVFSKFPNITPPHFSTTTLDSKSNNNNVPPLITPSRDHNFRRKIEFRPTFNPNLTANPSVMPMDFTSALDSMTPVIDSMDTMMKLSEQNEKAHKELEKGRVNLFVDDL